MPTDCVCYYDENGEIEGLKCRTAIPYDWFDREVLNCFEHRYALINQTDPDYRKVFNDSILNNEFHIDKIYADKKKKTIAVKWTDGTVTKAKTTENFDLETGVAMAVLKKVIISHHHLQKIIEKKTIFTNEVKKEK